MKIIYVVETYTKGLGYIDNLLPKYLAALGNDVHVVTSRLPVYYQLDSTQKFKSHGYTHMGEETSFGVTIHTLRPRLFGNRITMTDLKAKLVQLDPDIVIVRGLSSPVLGQVVYSKFFCKFKIFTSAGMAYSVASSKLSEPGFNKVKLLNWFSRKLPGRIFSKFIEKCIGSTDDCVDAAVDFYGVPRKNTVMIPLGVDTEKYIPVINADLEDERREMRHRLGFSDCAIICIWSGRITPTKGIELLAQAVEELNEEGHNIKALFVGTGEYSTVLQNFKHSTLVDFQPWADLPKFYRMCDIAVWPKSLTTSTLDAAACGLPIIMSNKEPAVERWQGAGASYVESDISDLKRTILMFADAEVRQKLKTVAHNKMKSNYSWDYIAKQFENEFLNVCKK